MNAGRTTATSEAALAAAFFDLPMIFALRDTFAALDPTVPPCAIITAAAHNAPGTSPIGIFAGSFDPLTNAHVAVAEAARDAGCAAVYVALSRHTVDKEARRRPTDSDRALLARHWATGQERLGLLLFSHGLYADQAIAARALFLAPTMLRFIVGFDKARQIFDQRYYRDRDSALRTLFGQVSLLVVPRGGDGRAALDALLDCPENRPFRRAVELLPLDPDLAGDSATAVREAVRSGLPWTDLVPRISRIFVEHLGPYDPPRDDQLDRYAIREALIDALAADRAWALATANFQALFTQALAASPAGAHLRKWLQTPPAQRQPTLLRELLGVRH